MSEIIPTFDHLSTQLTWIRVRVKVSKCKLWNPSRIFLGMEISQGCSLITYALHILGVLVGSQDFIMHFFERGFILGRDIYWWSSFFGIHTCCFGHFIFMCHLSTFLSHSNNTFFFFLHVSFGRFWQENCVNMWGNYGSRVMRVYSRPFSKALHLTTNIFWWYRPYFCGGLCVNCFSKELGFVGSIFMLQVLYIQWTHFGGICFSGWRGPSVLYFCFM
jgi:hypothetical protein